MMLNAIVSKWHRSTYLKVQFNFIKLCHRLRKNDGQLQLVYHPESVFMRSEMNVKQPPRKVSFIKKKQGTELRPEYLHPVRQERRPVKGDVKRDCVQMAQKYLSKSAVQFYQVLPSIEEE